MLLKGATSSCKFGGNRRNLSFLGVLVAGCCLELLLSSLVDALSSCTLELIFTSDFSDSLFDGFMLMVKFVLRLEM